MEPIPAWHAQAACAGRDSRFWFPENGLRADTAKAICSGCPVRTVCADWAITNQIAFGIWGGTTPEDRSREYPR